MWVADVRDNAIFILAGQSHRGVLIDHEQKMKNREASECQLSGLSVRNASCRYAAPIQEYSRIGVTLLAKPTRRAKSRAA